MKEIIEAIKNAQSVAILPHVNADGDAIGSCQAMAALLRNMGKTAVIYAEEAVEPRLNFISDGICVYDGAVIGCDTCMVLDCGDELRMGTRKAIADAAKTVINIDHHKTNTYFGDVNLVIPDASATGEILTELCIEMGIEFTKEIAAYLYAAICSDTGSFAYSNVSPKTFRFAAFLVEKEIDHAEINRLLFDCVSLEQVLLKAELTSKIHSYYGGKLRIVTVNPSLVEKCGVPESEVQDVVDIPRRIRGTEIAVSIKISDGKIRASLRSTGDCDVAAIALKLGGGGHAKAAGCTVEADSLEAAENLIVETFREVLE